MGHVLLLLEVVLHKALHAGDAWDALVAVEDLLVDSGKGVVRIGIELALKLGERLHEDLVALGVRVLLRPVHSVNLRFGRLQRPEHVVEGAVFHHEYDNVFQGIETWRHRAAPFVCDRGFAIQRSPIDSASASISDLPFHLNVYREEAGGTAEDCAQL